MKIQLINPSLNKLCKYISYEEPIEPEAVALQEKFMNCELLRQSLVPWTSIKQIVSMSRSNYYRYRKLMKLELWIRFMSEPRFC